MAHQVKIAFILSVLAGAIHLYIGVRPALAQDCGTMIRMHAFASRAQFQCGFREYNPNVIEQAKTCGSQMTESERKSNITTGMQMFDELAQKVGQREACSDVLRKLPNVVRQ